MTKTSQTTLTCLMVILPVLGSAQQICQTETIKATTPTVRYFISSHGWVLDKNTGLMWKKCSEGQQWNKASRTCSLAAGTYTWQQALQRVQTLNTKGRGFDKYKDWRLPNIKELRTLVEDQCAGPAINLGVFPTTGQDAIVWSSSANTKDIRYAWAIAFSHGSAYPTIDKLNKQQVWLVRGGK